MRKLDALFVGGLALLLIVLFGPIVFNARQAARRSQSANNLKQLAVALHNYQETFGCLPPGGVCDGSGRGMQGWCRQLTPFLDGSGIGARIDDHYAWDQAVNRHVFRDASETLLNPSLPHTRTTEGYGLLHYAANPAVLHRNSSFILDADQVPPSSYWMLGEIADDLAPWGDPFQWREWNGELDRPSGFGGGRSDGALFVMGDGSVRHFTDETSPEVRREIQVTLPAPPLDRTAVPVRNYRMSDKEWRTESIVLEAAPEGSNSGGDLRAAAMRDERGNAIHVSLRSTEKRGAIRSPRIDDLATIQQSWPEVRELVIALPVDADVAQRLAQLTRLTTLHVTRIDPSPTVIEQFRLLRDLRNIAVRTNSQEELEQLRSLLPGVEIINSQLMIDTRR